MLINYLHTIRRTGILLTGLLLLGTQFLHAQEAKLSSETYTEHRYYPLKGKAFYTAYRQVRGSAYLYDDWTEGDIYLKSGELIKNVQFKIDVYAHYLLVYNEYLKRVIILEQKEIDKFTFKLAGQESTFKHIKANRNLKSMRDEFFLEVLMEGHISLYKLYYRDITPLRAPEMPYIDEFVRGEGYFIVYQDEWEGIRLRRSSLNHKFPLYKSEIKQYARKNKLHYKQEKDVAQILQYLSEIVELVDEAK